MTFDQGSLILLFSVYIVDAGHQNVMLAVQLLG